MCCLIPAEEGQSNSSRALHVAGLGWQLRRRPCWIDVVPAEASAIPGSSVEEIIEHGRGEAQVRRVAGVGLHAEEELGDTR